jgi:3-oxoacyl-ACP reductase-like protein
MVVEASTAAAAVASMAVAAVMAAAVTGNRPTPPNLKIEAAVSFPMLAAVSICSHKIRIERI